MKINISKLLVLSLALLLLSCTPKSESTNKPPTPELTTPTVTTSSVLTPVNTSTVHGEILNSCIELKPDGTNNSMNGLLLLRTGSDANSYNFLDLKTSVLSKIPEQAGNVYIPLVSPDMKHLIGEVCTEVCNYVLRTSDRIVNTIPSMGDWVLRQWLDNERVIILSLHEPHDVVLLNPFTGRIEKVDLGLPDPYINIRTETESLIPVSLDPSIKRALFYDENFGGRLVLWDIEQKKEITSLPYNVDRTVGFHSYDWSPDGQTFVTESPDNRTSTLNALFSLDMNGKLSRLSNYDQKYDFANITSPVWSPDNEHVAFWLKIGTAQNTNPDDLPQYLAIINVHTMETKIYCQTFSIPFYPAFAVFWSSDGQQLVTNTRTDEGIVEPILIDLVHLTKTNIDTHGGWVEGWIMP